MGKRSQMRPHLEAVTAVVGIGVVVATGFLSLTPSVGVGARDHVAEGELTPELSRFFNDAEKMPVRLTIDSVSGAVISITLDQTSEVATASELNRSANELAAQAFGLVRDPIPALLQAPVLIMESDLVTGRILSITRVNESPGELGQWNWFD